ncbi:DUF2730 family protein [Aliihoeflea sp. PC F10.4]
MDQLMRFAMEQAPAVSAGVILTVFVMTFILKATGFSLIGDKAKVVDGAKMTNVSAGVDVVRQQLSDIDKRLVAVEQDLQNRPTKEDHHRLELSFTRLEGEVRSTNITVQATANGVSRIEEFMYSAAQRQRGGVA